MLQVVSLSICSCSFHTFLDVFSMVFDGIHLQLCIFQHVQPAALHFSTEVD